MMFIRSGEPGRKRVRKRQEAVAMKDVKKILVVCRDTKYSQEAVHCGVSLARKYEASLSILHVVHDPFGMEGWNLPFLSVEEDYKRVLEEAKADLHNLIAAEKAKGLQIKELIREGEPSREILKVIGEEKIDLLLVLGHKEDRLEHFLFGRSNEDLIRKMPCSILLVKQEPEP
jgi:universal stress protein A